jgi:hypothetical protein
MPILALSPTKVRSAYYMTEVSRNVDDERLLRTATTCLLSISR